MQNNLIAVIKEDNRTTEKILKVMVQVPSNSDAKEGAVRIASAWVFLCMQEIKKNASILYKQLKTMVSINLTMYIHFRNFKSMYIWFGKSLLKLVYDINFILSYM